MIEKPVVWVPNDALKSKADGWRYTYVTVAGLPRAYERVLVGAEQPGLSELSPTVKLFVFAHGHGKFPAFACGEEGYTAIELAALLESAGLNKDHREIELLVCDAALSVGANAASTSVLLRLRQEYRDARATGVQAEIDRAREVYELALSVSPEVTHEYTNRAQTTPLACKFKAAMFMRDYQHLKVIAYKALVATTCTNGETAVQPTEASTPRPISRVPHLRVELI